MNKRVKEKLDRLDALDEINSIDIANLHNKMTANYFTILRKVECGAAATHNFRLLGARYHEKIDPPYTGIFECRKCFLKVERAMTKIEHNAAKKLGMIE